MPTLHRSNTSSYIFELYNPPAGMSICESLHKIFSHYCSPWKTAISSDHHHIMIDSASFVKMCKDAPGLESKRIGRQEFDLVFTKARDSGNRRLDYEHFLLALLDLATRKYPDDDPPSAFAKLLARHIFGLFDQPPTADNSIIERIREELD
mmetsp:Transcript_3189/g.4946  ORF Transcript_3189/g.4946 Transcript_3189/m.4946 type:complete len:151 (+) Transcript_3189:72-524(+)